VASGLVKFVGRQGQALAQGAIGIETEPLGIGDGEQKEIEGTGSMAELINETITDQALIDPTELAWDASEFGGTQGVFGDHEGLLALGLNR
jgi:hypothetical protein